MIGRPWPRGTSGNPKGRPMGAAGHRQKQIAALEKMLDDESERIVRATIQQALAGDTTCVRLVIERLLPVRKERAHIENMPEVRDCESACEALARLIQAASSGETHTADATALGSLVQSFIAASTAREFATRLSQLEQSQRALPPADEPGPIEAEAVEEHAEQ